MERLRKEDLSLHHYIKNGVLASFIETETKISLDFIEDESTSSSYVYEAVSVMAPSPTSKGRGWVYLDDVNSSDEQSTAVTVYESDGVTVISGTNYMIDYVDGRAIFSSGIIVPYYVTYKWNYVSVVNEWPMDTSSDVPIVVVDLDRTKKEGFQLGGGKKVSRNGNIHIFAYSTAERDDLKEILYDGFYLRSCPNIDFISGSYIDWDGTFNSGFQYTTISGYSKLFFEDIEARNVVMSTIPSREFTMLSDVNRYRARISFTMCHWEEA